MIIVVNSIKGELLEIEIDKGSFVYYDKKNLNGRIFADYISDWGDLKPDVQEICINVSREVQRIATRFVEGISAKD